MDNFYIQTLPSETAKIVDKLQKERLDFLEKFYLSGGTALSLQLGHRESEDLDFFTGSKFKPVFLQSELEKLGQLRNVEIAKGTFNVFIDGVKLQFLEYPYQLLKKCSKFGQISLSSVIDIACTKLQTIGARGSKKDFIDLFFILDKYSLDELFIQLKNKYSKTIYNEAHILKSLVYFVDADKQPDPRMHKNVTWVEVKSKIMEKVREFSI